MRGVHRGGASLQPIARSDSEYGKIRVVVARIYINLPVLLDTSATTP